MDLGATLLVAQRPQEVIPDLVGPVDRLRGGVQQVGVRRALNFPVDDRMFALWPRVDSVHRGISIHAIGSSYAFAAI